MGRGLWRACGWVALLGLWAGAAWAEPKPKPAPEADRRAGQYEMKKGADPGLARARRVEAAQTSGVLEALRERSCSEQVTALHDWTHSLGEAARGVPVRLPLLELASDGDDFDPTMVASLSR